MNTRELAELEPWNESELESLVSEYVRTFHRLPSIADLRPAAEGITVERD
jgi:hypothetical protein